MMRPAASRHSSVMASTSSSTAITLTKYSSWPWPSPTISRMVVSAPGPAMSGNASGNTEMSSLKRASASSRPVVERPPDWRANTMSMAMRNKRMPPAILKAGRLIPRVCSSQAPMKANMSRMAVASSVPLKAMRRRWMSSQPPVSAPNMGVTPNGSTTTNSTMNMLMIFSSVMCVTRVEIRVFTRGYTAILDSFSAAPLMRCNHCLRWHNSRPITNQVPPECPAACSSTGFASRLDSTPPPSGRRGFKPHGSKL